MEEKSNETKPHPAKARSSMLVAPFGQTNSVSDVQPSNSLGGMPSMVRAERSAFLSLVQPLNVLESNEPIALGAVNSVSAVPLNALLPMDVTLETS